MRVCDSPADRWVAIAAAHLIDDTFRYVRHSFHKIPQIGNVFKHGLQNAYIGMSPQTLARQIYTSIRMMRLGISQIRLEISASIFRFYRLGLGPDHNILPFQKGSFKGPSERDYLDPKTRKAYDSFPSLPASTLKHRLTHNAAHKVL